MTKMSGHAVFFTANFNIYPHPSAIARYMKDLNETLNLSNSLFRVVFIFDHLFQDISLWSKE